MFEKRSYVYALYFLRSLDRKQYDIQLFFCVSHRVLAYFTNHRNKSFSYLIFVRRLSKNVIDVRFVVQRHVASCVSSPGKLTRSKYITYAYSIQAAPAEITTTTQRVCGAKRVSAMETFRHAAVCCAISSAKIPGRQFY